MKEARQKEINFFRFPVQKSGRPAWTNALRRKTLLQATVHAFVASILLAVSATNCHAIVNNLLNTADLNLINVVATVGKYSTTVC